MNFALVQSARIAELSELAAELPILGDPAVIGAICTIEDCGLMVDLVASNDRGRIVLDPIGPGPLRLECRPEPAAAAV